MVKNFLLVMLLVLSSCKVAKGKYPLVLIKTNYGDIKVELYPDKATKTVAAFLSYVDAGYYKNASFYRVLSNENVPAENNTGLIQGGIYETNPQKLLTIPGIPHEPTKQTGLSHADGTISLARTLPGTASTEFFICIGDQPQFNSTADSVNGQGFAAFGTVVEGMDIVRQIQNSGSRGETFNTLIKISAVERL